MKQLRIALVLLPLAALWYWQNQTPTRDAPARTPSPVTRSNLPATQPLPPLPDRDLSPFARGASAPRVTPKTSRELPAFLPPEAHQTLALIADGGPFLHRQDGYVFQNREGRLPSQARGYYREYTVRTPGERDRGARRIVTGGDPPSEYWYSDDHYDSFQPIEVSK